MKITNKIKYQMYLNKAKKDGLISLDLMTKLFDNGDFCHVELANFNDVSVFYIFNNDIAIINFIRKTYYYQSTSEELSNKNSCKNLAYFNMNYFIDSSFDNKFKYDKDSYILNDRGFGESIVFKTIVTALHKLMAIFSEAEVSTLDQLDKTRAVNKFFRSFDPVLKFYNDIGYSDLSAENEFFSSMLNQNKDKKIFYDYALDNLCTTRQKKIVDNGITRMSMEREVWYDFRVPSNNQCIYNYICGKDNWEFDTNIQKEKIKFSFKEYLTSQLWFAYILYNINKKFKTKFNTWYGYYRLTHEDDMVLKILSTKLKD